MTLYIKYHHMNSRNSEIRIKILESLYMPTICNFAVLPSRLLVSTRLCTHSLQVGQAELTPSNHIFFEVCLQYYLKMAILDHFQKSDLEKWGRGEIPNPHLGGYPPQSFLIYYTVEYQ